MPREALTTTSDYGAKEGKLASHRWLGANTVMSKLYNYDVQMEKTIAFLHNGVFNVDIFRLEKSDGKLIAPLGTHDFNISAGDTLTASILIQNKGIAHSHVPEQRDMYETWVQFEAKYPTLPTLPHSDPLHPPPH